jgi:hypothetical protein
MTDGLECFTAFFVQIFLLGVKVELQFRAWEVRQRQRVMLSKRKIGGVASLDHRQAYKVKHSATIALLPISHMIDVIWLHRLPI